MNTNRLPKLIHIEYSSCGHVQGIAVDTAHKYIYVSFTTVLVKADMTGNIIGSVTGLTGHLGCIDFNDEDGKVYGSLEYKRDSIGKGIAARLGTKLVDEDAFYIAIFDVDKIDRIGMDGEKDNIMKASYLPDVVSDFSYEAHDGTKHRYGCSGIDGTTIGKVFGMEKGTPSKLFTAYGIYGDNSRSDNDCQIILQYDWRKLSEAASPLSQEKLHHNGADAEKKYFLYTGNTTWGVQNLEYDSFTGDFFAAVYKGKKEKYPNYPMFVIDGSCAPEEKELPGSKGEKGLMLKLKETKKYDEKSGIYGSDFPYGSTGICSLGDGYFLFSHDSRVSDDTYATDVKLYRITDKEELFEIENC
ncbi:MAG: hypothetical protein E7665_07955 [Ruminococcaceae bacterium]|nr:hypothetical protein [Oscillospiraceae bacterium]